MGRGGSRAAPAATALPDEVWEHVFSFLPGPADSDRGAAAAACRPSLADRYAAVDPVPDKERLSALTGSQYCHTKHGQIEHKIKCKQMKSLDPADKLSCGGEVNSSKSSALGHISLVPLPACKKISKGQVLFPYDEFLKLYNWKDLDVAPCGLINSGNSCFANVVLQCLSCTRPLVAYLLGKDHSRECSMRCQEWCFLCELQCHIHRATESLQPFAPTNILSHLPNIGGNLGIGRQEDAHELLRFAIDKMQSACLHEYGGEKAVDLSTQETTIIHHIFGGRLRSQVQCTGCGMVSNRYDNMMDLTVEIQGDADSLEKCLDQFTAIEWLDGDNKYRCDGCNDYLDARKHLSVHQAPNILTITLKRFQSGIFGKLNKRVTFPMELDLKPYMDCKDGSDLYDLYAVVVHLDTLNASFVGHYICYIKGYQGRWYKIDDCKVMVVDEDEVHAQGAYMLLYSRKTPHLSPLVTIDESVKQQQQRTVLPSNGRSHMMLADATLNCESSLKTNSIFVDLCGTSIPIQVNTETATARELVDLALQKKEIGYADVYLMYSGKIIDCASQLRLLHIPKGASFTIVPRCRAGAVMESLLINPVKFVDFVRDMKPFYRVKIPDALRHKDITGNIYIIFLSQPARCLVHMMIVCLSILHAEGKSLSGKFEVTDFLFWNGCAIIRREDWDRASKVNVILDFRKLSQIIDWLFRRRGLQPTVFPGRDGQLPAYLAELISLLRVFVHQGDSALRAYASNHPALLSFRGRIRKILELEVFYNFMEFAVKAIFKSAIGLFEGWASHIPRVDPLKETYMFNRDFSDHGMDYIEVSRNFLSHPSEQKRGGSKRSAIPIEFTEEEAEAALTLYCGPAHLHEFLLRTVTRFEFTAGVDRKLICGNEVADANARGGKSSGLDFSV